MPGSCGCGQQNSMNHLLICKKGGYVNMRHNALRDCEAKLMKEVCRDVRTEPMLIPTDEELVTGTAADRARLDVAGRGVWSGYERTFVDVKVVHPTADTHMQKQLKAVYVGAEKEKKAKYNQRVIDIEKGTFTPTCIYDFWWDGSGMPAIQQAIGRTDIAEEEGGVQPRDAAHSMQPAFRVAPGNFGCGTWCPRKRIGRRRRRARQRIF